MDGEPVSGTAPTALDDFLAELKARPRLLYTGHALRMAERAVELEGGTWRSRRYLRAMKFVLNQPRTVEERLSAIEKILALPDGERMPPIAAVAGWSPACEPHNEMGDAW